MPFSISDIVARISNNGLARNNRFSVQFPIPNLLLQNQGAQSLVNAAKNVECWIEETNLPGVALITHAHRRYGYGPKEERPYAAGFGELSTMVRGDMNGDFYKFFAAWARIPVNYDFRDGMSDTSGISQNQYAYEVAYPSSYRVPVTITTYREDNQPSITITLRDAYPKYFGGDTMLSWHRKNEYLRFPVVFAYSDWSLTGDTDSLQFGSQNV